MQKINETKIKERKKKEGVEEKLRKSNNYMKSKQMSSAMLWPCVQSEANHSN